MFKDSGERTNIPFVVNEMMEPGIKEAGFVNVVNQVLKAPLGPWPADRKFREIGIVCLHSFLTGLEGWAMAMATRVMGVSVLRIR